MKDNDIDKILASLTHLICAGNRCQFFMINEEKLPDCKLPTKLSDGYIKGYGFDTIDCKFYKPILKVVK